jgi:HEAT repeat protein
MYRIPPEFRFFFPQFFAIIGTADAISILRHLIEEGHSATRVEAISCAARLGRDDLLPIIRASLTHTNIAEQEASAYALGLFKDTKSRQRLKALTSSSSDTVRLAVYKTLYALGDASAKEAILSMVQSRHLFAIAAAACVPEAKESLAALLHDPIEQVRLNAAFSLLRLRDERCLPSLYEVLIRDKRDLGFIPQFSLGKSHLVWKAIPSAKQHQQGGFDIASVSMQLKEQLLKEALGLSEGAFLQLSRAIFDSRQTELLPQLTALLANLQTEAAIDLLKEKAASAGAPLTRGYCNLSLFRLKKEGPYKQQLMEWIVQNKKSELIRFRPMAQMDQRLSNDLLGLTPEDPSRLLIDAYGALADRHDEQALNFLLEILKTGNPKNRHLLAGLLLRSLQ